MMLLIVALFGSAIAGNSFFKFTVGPVNILSILIVCTSIIYVRTILKTRRAGSRYSHAISQDKWLWGFFLTGSIVVIFSYLGLYRILPFDIDLLYDSSYIPRQAFYLFFFPLMLLAGRSYKSIVQLSLILKHRTLLFFLIYFAHLFITGSFALGVSSCFLLGMIILIKSDKRPAVDLLLFALFMLNPIGAGGELTQIIIRILTVVLYLQRDNSNILQVGVVSMLAVIVACYCLPLMPVDSLGLDQNSYWRAQYWADEMNQLGKTCGFGVGYGTSYATRSFAGNAIGGPFGADENYTAIEKLYVVGCHNSFVSLLFRLGVIGIAPLFGYLICVAKSEPMVVGEFKTAATFSLVASLVIVCFNVGLESPSYFFAFCFAIAFIRTQYIE